MYNNHKHWLEAARGGGAYLLSGEGADPAQGWRVPVEMHVTESGETETVT